LGDVREGSLDQPYIEYKVTGMLYGLKTYTCKKKSVENMQDMENTGWAQNLNNDRGPNKPTSKNDLNIKILPI